jgi:hypothetical protein
VVRMFRVQNDGDAAVPAPAAPLALVIPINPFGALLVAGWGLCQGVTITCSVVTQALDFLAQDGPDKEQSEDKQADCEDGSFALPPANGLGDNSRSPADDPAVSAAASCGHGAGVDGVLFSPSAPAATSAFLPPARRTVRRCRPAASRGIIRALPVYPAAASRSSATRRNVVGVPPPILSEMQRCAAPRPP